MGSGSLAIWSDMLQIALQGFHATACLTNEQLEDRDAEYKAYLASK